MDQLNQTIGQFTPDNLIAGHEVPLLTKGVQLLRNQGEVQRGTVIGIVTASGLAKPVNSAAVDGSEVPYGILADTIDTGSGAAASDPKAVAYISGLFNTNALVFGGTDDAADHEAKLRDRGIFLKENISY